MSKDPSRTLRAWWFALLAVGSLLFGTAVPSPPSGQPCPDFQFVPAQGWSCPVPGGWVVHFDDGTTAPTHGPDFVGPEGDGGPLPAAVPSDPVCVADPANDYYQYVIYAVPSDRTNRYGSVVGSIRSLMRTVNGQLNEAAAESGGQNANFKVHCAGTTITVANENLPRPQSTTTYNTIVSDLRARGYNKVREAYWVWYDGAMSGVCGQGTLYQDDSLSSGNPNNNGNDFAIYYAGTSGCTAERTWMHENAHTTGGVQDNAPRSSRAGHCNDGLDIVCYRDGGSAQCTTGGQLCENRCFDFQHFDCGHDTYFHTAAPAGSWLASHWNLGNPLNRFYHFGATGTPIMRALSCAPNPSQVGQTATCTFHATDDSTGVYYTVQWGDGSPSTRVPASGTVPPGTNQTAQHAWNADGSFTVSVTATDDGTPPRTSDPLSATQNVGSFCSLLRQGAIPVGLLFAPDLSAVNARTEAIPAACVGKGYTLTGTSVAGSPADFDVCWRDASGGDIRCDTRAGNEAGIIPDGTVSARVILFLGYLGSYTLRAPV